MHPALTPDNPEGQANPGEQLYAGKYRTPEDLAQGYQSLYSLSLDTFRKNEELQARLSELEQTRINPSERSQERMDARQTLEEVGVPAAAVEEIVQRTLDRTLNPVFEGVRARTQLTKTYPDYERVEDQLAQFIGSNPELKSEYQRVYQVSPRVAMEWAYGQFQRVKGNPQSASGSDEVAARLDALLTGGSDRGAAMDAAGEADEKAAWDHFNRTGDMSAVIKLRSRQTIPNSHFNALPGAF
jgi:hypothetical protein